MMKMRMMYLGEANLSTYYQSQINQSQINLKMIWI